ncbi:hypothetical protein GOB49_28445, partial [Sinorhizobium meliloti]|nr:hypothetical protein [Sinorhizobium meliloti]MDW9621093.1 hypothetical protein [Sinorhizobium meliloti]MDX0159227.1 hypothetical protein [Sinorhizobium meliloti]MDX0178218.1 hypothetical protein [Sinorhizobium meliloti]
RGRLFLGIGGRDHFGIRGRIASEFASISPVGPPPAMITACSVIDRSPRGSVT